MLNMMRIILPLPLIVLLTTLAFTAGADIGKPPEFDVIYDVYRSGMRVAKMERSISRNDDGVMLYRSETNLTGIASVFRKDRIIEQSLWEYDDGKLVPLQYEYLHTGIRNERNVTVEFDWDENQIINSVNGSTWKMPGVEGVLDKLLYQYSLMRDMRSGQTHFTYTIADGGTEKLYVFESLGEEVIETPLGKMRTIKVVRHREDSDRKSTFWSAPDIDYLPVKLENVDDGVTTLVMINSINGLNYDQRITQK